MSKTYTIDGDKFTNIEGFYGEIDFVLLTENWGRNLDAFDDVLRGGFGTPGDGFTLIWKNSAKSRLRLGQNTFLTLVEIIKTHGKNGREPDDNVLLILD